LGILEQMRATPPFASCVERDKMRPVRKLKLVISDFHIGKGRWLPDGTLNPLEQFIYDEKLVQFLEWYSSERFKQVEVELILNGDFLNTIQVAYDEKFPEAITESGSLAKVKAIAEGHPEIFQALKKFAATENHSITYLYGNHEPALLWPKVRQYLDGLLGAQIRYPGFSYSFDGIYIEHGQQYHTINKFDVNRLFLTKGVPEPILNIPWGTYFVIKFLNQLKLRRPYIDRIHPFGRYLLLGMFFDPVFAHPAVIKLFVFMIRRHFAWLPGQANPLLMSFRMLKDISIYPKLAEQAWEIMKTTNCHTVIFGHDHKAAYRKLGENLYVNTGTWNDSVHLDIPNLGRQRRMTYAQIEYDDDNRPQTRLKIWKGTRLVEEDVIF
jgi:UDP-2,3-diacylglucosamine pyrophosphatase LpxH